MLVVITSLVPDDVGNTLGDRFSDSMGLTGDSAAVVNDTLGQDVSSDRRVGRRLRHADHRVELRPRDAADVRTGPRPLHRRRLRLDRGQPGLAGRLPGHARRPDRRGLGPRRHRGRPHVVVVDRQPRPADLLLVVVGARAAARPAPLPGALPRCCAVDDRHRPARERLRHLHAAVHQPLPRQLRRLRPGARDRHLADRLRRRPGARGRHRAAADHDRLPAVPLVPVRRAAGRAAAARPHPRLHPPLPGGQA